MKTKIITIALALTSLFTSQVTKAQTTAMDFTIMDCNGGGPHNLYSDLNSGKAVIIEFFMTSCGSCITAGQKLEAMKSTLLAQYPGKIKSYAFGYNNSYSCTTVKNWVNNNGFTSIPSDSGAAQVAYYGGMGMPTIVILGGANHAVLGSPYIGFTTSDTTTMANDIRTLLNSVGVKENNKIISDLNIYPNPANTEFKVSTTISASTHLVIDVVDITGRVVLKALDETVEAGSFNKTINTSDLAVGNYVVRINANGSITQQKLSIVR